MRLGFIGCGNMGGAMVSGILKKQLLASEDMIASALHEESRKALREKFGIPDPEAFHILLAHNPVYFDTYAAWGADLTLSGHLHGGIIRIPGIGGLITPQAQLFPKYDRGLISVNGKYMVVSAGLGEHTVPIRIFNPPQLILITVEGNA